jgi:putative MATE family efflux protein
VNASPRSTPAGSRAGRSLASQAINLAWPAGIDQLIQTSVLFADILLLSRLGSEVIAGVGVAAVLIFTFASIYTAVGVAATTVSAQAKGAGRLDVLAKGAGQSILLAFLFGLASGAVGARSAAWTMKQMGTDGSVLAYGATYMRIVLLASPLYAIALAGGGILRGTGDTRNPMIYTFVSTVAKVFLSVVLIFGKLGFPALGVTGAALGTFLGYGLNAVMIGTKVSVGFSGTSLTFRSFSPDWGIARRVLLLWLPVALELFFMRVGFVFYMRVVSALGTIALAANQIAVRLESVALTMGFGFAVAATALVGQAVGRRDLDQAHRSTMVTAKLAIAAMGGTAVFFFLIRNWAVGLFEPEGAVRGIAVMCAAIAAFELLPISFLFTFSGALRGAGDTVSPMAVSLIGTFAFRLPLVYLLGIRSGLGVVGIWYGTISDWTLRSVVIYVVYRMGWWKRRGVVAAPVTPVTGMVDSESVVPE